MPNLLLHLAYDGTDFNGYQIQANGRTVQGELERALSLLHDHPVRVAAAGRTDSGVHATGQCVTFASDHRSLGVDDMPAAINSRLPADVRVLAAREVPEGFHARFDARARHYRYYLLPSRATLPHLRRYVWRVAPGVDPHRMGRDAAAFVGTHDFTTFAARAEERSSMERSVHYADLTVEERLFVFAIGADGFLWRMVRSMVGTLVEREMARLRGDDPGPPMDELLRARDRSRAGTTAPAWGLFLHRVDYDL